jgi:hypothetical protein
MFSFLLREFGSVDGSLMEVGSLVPSAIGSTDRIKFVNHRSTRVWRFARTREHFGVFPFPGRVLMRRWMNKPPQRD